MTEREALKLALDWFCCYSDKSMSRNNQETLAEEAITAIKEALAQPEQEPVTLSEGKKLILVDSSFDDLMYWLERCESKGHLENCSDLIEPWEKFCDSYCVWTDHHPDCKLAERLPLTDEEIYSITGVENRDEMMHRMARNIARAIEAAHGIKGEA